jgi:hypothetical protein
MVSAAVCAILVETREFSSMHRHTPHRLSASLTQGFAGLKPKLAESSALGKTGFAFR